MSPTAHDDMVCNKDLIPRPCPVIDSTRSHVGEPWNEASHLLLAQIIIHVCQPQFFLTITFHFLSFKRHGWAVGLNEIKQSYMKLICPTA